MAADQHLSVRIAHRTSNGFALEAGFEAPAGFTMLLGPSGGGKTTILNCIAGFVRPDTGRIAIGPRALFDSDERIDLPSAERQLGYVFQNLALFPHLTVAQNVQYGIVKIPAAERRARMMAMLESFRIAHLLARKPGEISGGERQRAALARSLVTNPAALLLDEPLTALDQATKSKILDDLRAWNTAHEIPILYVTHSAEEAFALGERVVVLEGGRILAQGMPQLVLTTPRHETIAQVVGFENVFDATVKSIAELQGTMLCQLDGTETQLEVPLGHAESRRSCSHRNPRRRHHHSHRTTAQPERPQHLPGASPIDKTRRSKSSRDADGRRNLRSTPDARRNRSSGTGTRKTSLAGNQDVLMQPGRICRALKRAVPRL